MMWVTALAVPYMKDGFQDICVDIVGDDPCMQRKQSRCVSVVYRWWSHRDDLPVEQNMTMFEHDYKTSVPGGTEYSVETITLNDGSVGYKFLFTFGISKTWIDVKNIFDDMEGVGHVELIEFPLECETEVAFFARQNDGGSGQVGKRAVTLTVDPLEVEMVNTRIK
jgi:hypothetical protein